MRVALFCHSLRSDWNHGNAHFLRGVARELLALGHDVRVFEPADGWSATHLAAEEGTSALAEFLAYYPDLASCAFADADPSRDLDEALDGVDLVLVHEWNDPALVARIGRWRAGHRHARLLWHDTHHRSMTNPEEIAAFDLREYDGVLAFGGCIRQMYLDRGWTARAWTWHEAADTRLFQPIDADKTSDVIWIGNWAGDERAAEIDEFLLGPVSRLGARAEAYGVRYPDDARARLAAAGVAFGGRLANYHVPAAFARAKVTVHVPRRPYARALPGIPTIRPFEALACGIPLVSAPWDDVEHLFRPGVDFLTVQTGAEMEAALRRLLGDPAARAELSAHGLATIRARHTCAHRVRELLSIAADLGLCQADPSASRVPA